MVLSDVSAIDIHSHYNHGVRHDSGVNPIYQCDLEFLKNTYEAANVSIGCFSSFSSVLASEDVVEENDYNFQLSQQFDWFYNWVVIEPRIEKTFQQAKEYIKNNKCVGIKIHPPLHEYPITDYADKIFSLAAEYGTVVLMHPDNMPAMPSFADKYRDMRLIIAHLGTGEHVDAIANARYGNIYTDTSGSASINNNVVEYAIKRVGSEKILFGTDTYSTAFQRGRIEYAPISQKDKLNILRDNALREFPMIKI